jgi:DNA-binding MarR family transcriptional regulator
MNFFSFWWEFCCFGAFCGGYGDKLMFQEQSSDTDSKRTVTLSHKDLTAARRLLRLLLGVERELSEIPAEPGRRPTNEVATLLQREALLARAQDEFHNRRHRVSVFGSPMFGEAAWDMLLALYIMDASGPRHTVGSLLQFSGSPMSTAQRWLDYLHAHELVRREEHPTDRRTYFIALTDNAREKLDLYFSGTLAIGV